LNRSGEEPAPHRLNVDFSTVGFLLAQSLHLKLDFTCLTPCVTGFFKALSVSWARAADPAAYNREARNLR
jgi:hypothetical protein